MPSPEALRDNHAVPDPTNEGRLGQVRLGRRECLLGALALASLPRTSWAGADPLAGLQRWGSGRFRRFGFLVYDATLWAGADPQRLPLALVLTYRRRIDGRDIAEASVDEMRKLGAAPALLRPWGERMAQLFPDVKDGDRIVGLHTAEGARFVCNGRELGEVNDPEFARRFFGIWLDPRTSAPELRAALLRRPAGSG